MEIISLIFSAAVDSIHHSERTKTAYNELVKAYSNGLDCFIASLSAEQKSAALRLEEQRNLIASMDEELMFCQGFRIGARLMMDINHPATSA